MQIIYDVRPPNFMSSAVFDSLAITTALFGRNIVMDLECNRLMIVVSGGYFIGIKTASKNSSFVPLTAKSIEIGKYQHKSIFTLIEFAACLSPCVLLPRYFVRREITIKVLNQHIYGIF